MQQEEMNSAPDSGTTAEEDRETELFFELLAEQRY